MLFAGCKCAAFDTVRCFEFPTSFKVSQTSAKITPGQRRRDAPLSSQCYRPDVKASLIFPRFNPELIVLFLPRFPSTAPPAFQFTISVYVFNQGGKFVCSVCTCRRDFGSLPKELLQFWCLLIDVDTVLCEFSTVPSLSSLAGSLTFHTATNLGVSV